MLEELALLILTSFLLHWSQVIVLLTKVQDAQWTQALSFTIAYCIGYSTITFARHLRLGTTTTFIDMLILVLNAVAFTISVSYLVPLRHALLHLPSPLAELPSTTPCMPGSVGKPDDLTIRFSSFSAS